MIKMKDSGIPWIGQIPEDWVKCFLKNSFNFEKGKNASLYTSEYLSDNKGEIPVYSGQTENNGIMGFVKDYDYFSTGCLFVTTVGAKAMTIKILKGKFCLSQNCLIMQEKKNININFWFYALQILFDYEKSIMFGIMQPSLRIEDLKKYAIFLPNKEIQQKIVEILDKKCGQIDELVRIEENEIEKLKEYKTSLITKVVTKGLDSNAKMKDSGIPWIGQIPENWKVGRLKNFYLNRIEKYNGQNLNYFALENIESWSGRFIETENIYDKKESILCYKNDCVFGKLRPYLAKAFLLPFDMCCSSEFAIFYSKINNTKYLFYCFISFGIIDVINSSTYGTKMPRANIEYILNLQFAIPTVIEQQQIVDYLDKRCEEIDNLIKIKQEKIEKLKEYKKSLIYQYVTGKKEVV